MADNLQEMLERAQAAQRVVEFWPQEKVDEMVLAVGWEAYKRETAEKCARLAVDETGLGVYEDKLIKHQKKTLGVVRDLQGVKTVGVIEEDKAKGLVKIAKPVGVIGAITPMTNSSSTMPCNGLPILKTTECGDLRTASQGEKYLRLHLQRNAQGSEKGWRTRRFDPEYQRANAWNFPRN